MISVAKLIQELGYDDSPNFVKGGSLAQIPSLAHVFRRAEQHCGLVGVYALRQDASLRDGSLVPVVYVCESKSEDDALLVHRRVWNQDVVPFVIVRTPQNVRIYSGFGYREGADKSKRTATRILNEAVAADDIASKLTPSFHADRIDDGTLWRQKGQHVTPEMRVDGRLLGNLERLGQVLRDQMKLGPHVANALIGKYVYLRYLRDRTILSDERLDLFNIEARSVFSRDAQLTALRSLIEQLDDWLNGSVFDIPWTQGVKAEHVKEVAGVFFGDDPRGQLNLFEDYDFSYIPIETLSVVYEQFLHSQGKAKDAGAYYTPIPLVNFILDELEARSPLMRGMRVLDPSCGSGAFLVQCYRRLIEKELINRKGEKPRPVELKKLLQEHIFGIDRDEDACQVTELSLSLTLLDYVDPPDLTNTNFKLPKLRGTNVFGGAEEDFFNTASQFHRRTSEKKFHWIVGNPPWTEFSTENPRREDEPVATWNAVNETRYPTGGNQIAELFAWKVTEHVQNDGKIGLLLPAMTLFKDESTAFRKAFFGSLKVSAVVNFANMAYVLFAGRAEMPAAAFFYQLRSNRESATDQRERILTFAPLVTNQEPNRPIRFNSKVDTWTIIVNGSEIREVDVADAAKGDALTWKLAMWGSHRDRRLLDSVASRFSSLLKEKEKRELTILEGFQLRDRHDNEKKAEKEKIAFVRELIGKDELITKAVRKFGRIFRFPPAVLRPVARGRAYLRVRGGRSPMKICRPPHIVVHASRNFAVFSDRFIVVPPRQIGIAGPEGQADFLKVLSLYLASDFALYHQFFNAPQWGISTSLANRDTLEIIPIPWVDLSPKDLSEWLDLHSRLVQTSPMEPVKKSRTGAKTSGGQKQFPFGNEELQSVRLGLIRDLNKRVYTLLGLRDTEQMLVEDFVQARILAIKGKVSKETAGIPEPDELERYAKVLKSELDEFFENDPRLRHKVGVLYDERSRTGMVEVELLKNHRGPLPVKVRQADASASADFDRARQLVRERRSQWLYFDRNLRIYEGARVLLTKPLQQIHWLRSQALLDADTIIAENLAAGEK
jgi:hypothetical protein